MAEKVTIKLEVDISDLEDMEESAEDAGEEMESTFDSIKDKIKETFTGDTFDSIKNALEGLNDIINDAVLGAVQALTDRLGILGDAIERVVKAVLNMKDQLLVGPINAFAGAVQALHTILKGLLESIPAVGDGLARMTDGFQSLIPVIISLSSLMQGFVSTQLAVLPGAIASVTGALGGLAVSFGASFQNQFAQVSSVMTNVNADMREFRQSVLQIADELPQGTKAVTQAMRQVVKAGITTREVVTTITDRLLRLAEISDGTAKSLSQNLIQVLTAFGTLDENPSESVTALTDDIRTLTEQTRAGVPQLIKAMSRIAPVADQVGASASKIGALGATIIQAGQEASRGGTRMRRAFQEIITSLANLENKEQLADIIGIDVNKLTNMIKNDFIGVIKLIGEEISSSEDNLERFSSLLGVTGEAGATALGALGSRFELFKKLLKDIQDNAGSVDRAFQKAIDTIFKQGQIILDLLNNTAKRLGTGLLEPITQFATTVADRLQMVQDEVRDIATIIENNIENATQNISDLFGIGDAELNISTFIDVGNEFTSAISGVFEDVFNNVVIPLGKTFAINTMVVLRGLFRSFFSSDFGELVWTGISVAMNRLINFTRNNVLPVFIELGRAVGDEITRMLNNISIDLPGIGKIGLGVEIEQGVPEGINRLVERLQKIEETNPEADILSSIDQTITKLDKLSKLFPRLSKQQQKQVRELIGPSGEISNIISEFQQGDFPEPKINDLNKQLENLLTLEQKIDLGEEFKKLENEIGGNLFDTLKNVLTKDIIEGETKKEMKNSIKNILTTAFPEAPTEEIISKAEEILAQIFGKADPPEAPEQETGTALLQQPLQNAKIMKEGKNIFEKFFIDVMENIRGEGLTSAQQKRAEEMAKKFNNDITNAWAKGIEANIKGEEFDVVQAISDSFVSAFSNELATQMAEKLRTEQTARGLADFITSTVSDVLQFVFDSLKTVIKNKKVQESIGSLFSIFTGSGGTASGSDATNFGSANVSSAGQARKGGPIGFASGGQVKGQGGIDQISAMLSRGEFVIRREAVNAQTLPFLKQLNENKGMRQGGSAGNTSSSMPADAQGNQRDVNINITAVDANSFQQLVENNPEVITNQILKDLDKNGRTRKAFQQKVDR